MMLAWLLIVLGYVLGSIPFAFLVARRWGHVDLRRSGSGNIGAANVFRTSGVLVGLSALTLDVAKGAIAVVLAQRLRTGSAGPTAAGIAAVIGHIYPIWLGFRGGKGVATACGAFAILTPVATAIATGVFVATVWRTRYVSLGSVVATLLLGPIAYLVEAPPAVVIGALLTAAIIVERHRPNLASLFAGVERRIGHEE
jgi:glycerol-3-phosphate acyltransferase PlsY